MKKLLLIAATSATILSSALTFAESPCDNVDIAQPSTHNENQWYLKLNAGATIFDKTKNKAANIKMKSNTSFVGEIGAGYYIMDNLRTDLTLGIVSTARLKKTVNEVNSAGNLETFATEHKPQIMSLLLNGFVDFVDVGMFKIFAGAGVGAASIKEKINNHSILSNNNKVINSNIESVSTKRKYNFAYQVSLGTSFEVAEGVKAELVYSYRDYGKTKTKKVVNATYSEGGTRYKGNNLMAGVRFDI